MFRLFSFLEEKNSSQQAVAVSNKEINKNSDAQVKTISVTPKHNRNKFKYRIIF